MTRFLEDFCEHWPTDAGHTCVDFIRHHENGSPDRTGSEKHFRLTEQWTSSPKSVSQFDVQGSVAKSTHAGLPWLRRIRNGVGDKIHVWPGLQSVGMVVRDRTIGEKDELQTSFFITSLAPKVRALASHIQGHWGIENSQHYIRDVIFPEDLSGIRSGTSPEISASIRRMAFNLWQRDKTVKDNIRGTHLRARWDETLLDKIWAAFSTT